MQKHFYKRHLSRTFLKKFNATIYNYCNYLACFERQNQSGGDFRHQSGIISHVYHSIVLNFRVLFIWFFQKWHIHHYLKRKRLTQKNITPCSTFVLFLKHCSIWLIFIDCTRLTFDLEMDNSQLAYRTYRCINVELKYKNIFVSSSDVSITENVFTLDFFVFVL